MKEKKNSRNIFESDKNRLEKCLGIFESLETNSFCQIHSKYIYILFNFQVQKKELDSENIFWENLEGKEKFKDFFSFEILGNFLDLKNSIYVF